MMSTEMIPFSVPLHQLRAVVEQVRQRRLLGKDLLAEMAMVVGQERLVQQAKARRVVLVFGEERTEHRAAAEVLAVLVLEQQTTMAEMVVLD